MVNQQCYTGQWVNCNNKWEQWDLEYCQLLFIVLVSYSSLLSHSDSFYRTVRVYVCLRPFVRQHLGENQYATLPLYLWKF